MQNAIAGCIVSTRILMPPHDKMSIKHDMGELFLKHMENKTIFVKQINRHKRAVLENIVECLRLYWHISFICKEHFKPRHRKTTNYKSQNR
jgi:hypothetical protein